MLFTDSSPLADGSLPIEINAHDRHILHSLAGRVAELAATPEQQQKRDRWKRHNDLQAERPLVFCDPENAWHEIIPDASLHCDGVLARMWEFRLRKEIFWGEEMLDDRAVEPYFDAEHVYHCTGWGVHVKQIGGENGGAYSWDAPIRTPDDVDRLHAPEIIIQKDATEQVLALAHEVMDGTLTVRLRTQWWWSLGLTWNLALWRGLQQLMFDMVDQPQVVQRMMTVLRDGTLSTLDSLEERGLLTSNNGGSYVGSGGFGYTSDLPGSDGVSPVTTQDMWGFCESQETVGVSPDMFEEFIYPYQAELMERFGLNCYGCCEPLDARWRVVKKLPRLRRISVSPWANRATMAEMLSDRYVYSMKPNPADLAMPEFDEESIRKSLREDLQASKGCHVEMIMKDTHTIRSDPSRVTRWVRIALEEAEGVE